ATVADLRHLAVSVALSEFDAARVKRGQRALVSVDALGGRRFPGKVLAPFRGRPIIWHVLDRVTRALPKLPRLVVTSTDPSDDPLAAYLADLGQPCFRGPLDDVLERFRLAAAKHEAAYVLRICADSPLLDNHVLHAVLAAHDPGLDLVTTTHPRTFPKGHNAELINMASLAALADLDAEDREHVTRAFHRWPGRFRIVNVESGDPGLAELELAIDTIEDLRRLESWA
ncbi:MAG: NTP transferase domain-containing protein, partial [Kofleriaceae bacterium]